MNGYNAKIGRDASTVMVIRIPFGEMDAIACVMSAPLDGILQLFGKSLCLI